MAVLLLIFVLFGDFLQVHDLILGYEHWWEFNSIVWSAKLPNCSKLLVKVPYTYITYVYRMLRFCFSSQSDCLSSNQGLR